MVQTVKLRAKLSPMSNVFYRLNLLKQLKM